MPVKTKSGEYVIFTDQPEGNSRVIISIVKDWIIQIWGYESQTRIDDYIEKAKSGDYDNLKKVSMEAVPGLLTFGDSTEYIVSAKKIG